MRARQETKDIRWGVGGGERSRQRDGSREEGFVVGNPLLSFLLFISSSSLWLSASLPCAVLSNLSRKQVRQADDEASDCKRGCREGGGGEGRNGGKETQSERQDQYNTRLTTTPATKTKTG